MAILHIEYTSRGRPLHGCCKEPCAGTTPVCWLQHLDCLQGAQVAIVHIQYSSSGRPLHCMLSTDLSRYRSCVLATAQHLDCLRSGYSTWTACVLATALGLPARKWLLQIYNTRPLAGLCIAVQRPVQVPHLRASYSTWTACEEVDIIHKHYMSSSFCC